MKHFLIAGLLMFCFAAPLAAQTTGVANSADSTLNFSVSRAQPKGLTLAQLINSVEAEGFDVTYTDSSGRQLEVVSFAVGADLRGGQVLPKRMMQGRSVSPEFLNNANVTKLYVSNISLRAPDGSLINVTPVFFTKR